LGYFVVNLDLAYYKLIDHLDTRFPDGLPSLRDCTHLTAQGDFKFGAGVVCRGDVTMIDQSGTQVKIDANTSLEGTKRW